MILFSVLSYRSIRLNPKFYQWPQQSSNLVFHWPNTICQGLTQHGSWKLQGNWRQTVFITITEVVSDDLVHFRFSAISVTARDPGGSSTTCCTHSETAEFLSVLQGCISFQDSLWSNYTPWSVTLCHIWLVCTLQNQFCTWGKWTKPGGTLCINTLNLHGWCWRVVWSPFGSVLELLKTRLAYKVWGEEGIHYLCLFIPCVIRLLATFSKGPTFLLTFTFPLTYLENKPLSLASLTHIKFQTCFL